MGEPRVDLIQITRHCRENILISLHYQLFQSLDQADAGF